MSPWTAVFPAWVVPALWFLAGTAAGLLCGFWLGGKDQESECHRLRMALAESDAAVRSLYAAVDRLSKRLVGGGAHDTRATIPDVPEV